MAKSLVIVESPAKVKTISKFLGRDYVVKSSIGHIRDLAKTGDASTAKKKTKKTPTKSKPADKASKEDQDIKKLVSRMGVDPYQDWAALYEIIPGKEKVLKGLKDAAESVDTIYLATDLDREGEAIAWHLRESIGGAASRYKRVTFTEITKNAIKDAFLKPTTLNINRVNAQQARRFLDRVVGYMLSPLLWAKVARGLSAGRVQSVAVRLISEREREIHMFKPEEYWEVFVDLLGGAPFSAQVMKHEGKPFRPTSAKNIDAPLKVLNTSPYRVAEVDKKPTSSRPSAPFITSTLQQAASVRFGYGVKKTMMLAQGLYEAGYITYMRTDSTNLSQDAVASCREFIGKHYGKAYLPQEPNIYTSKKSAQEAHEAIRPTDVNVKLAELAYDKDIDPDARKLYDLIWRQFVACQMTPAQYDSTAVSIECGSYELKARGRVLKFDGYLRVQPQMKKAKDEDSELPDLKAGDSLKLEEVKPSQHFTKPPPRFTDASLVRELEKQGIGRPSTYAAIISTIQDRGYVRVENRRFFCLKMGEIVTDRLSENFDDLMDYGFTAALEGELDKIADGEADWKEVLDQFYAKFYNKLKKASVDMRENDPTMTDVPCPQCQRPLQIRTARTGVFLSCSGYNLPPAERCKGTINLVPGDEYIPTSKSVEDDDEGDVAELQAKKRCTKCETAMDSYLIDESRKLHVCGNNPDCDGFQVELGQFKLKGYEGPIITCDKCGENMQLKTGRFGKYFACNGAPSCKNTRKLLRNGEAAPPKSDPIHMPELKCTKSDGYFVLRDGASGLFLAASTFPKSRETRKPLVSDLKRHRKELDPKYHFLADAPEKDPDGYPAQIRFSRKTKEHFVATETEDGKATGWSMYFSKGKWSKG